MVHICNSISLAGGLCQKDEQGRKKKSPSTAEAGSLCKFETRLVHLVVGSMSAQKKKKSLGVNDIEKAKGSRSFMSR